MNPLPEILFEDAHLIALNKPSGVLTEGGGDREEDLEQIAASMTGRRTLCCHRLDRLTSGVVLLRKTGKYKAELAQAFEKRKTRKSYWAIVDGVWDSRIQKIESEIAPVGRGVWKNVTSGGKSAVSTFRVLGSNSATQQSWLGVLLKTGRTHQARLHCLKAGYPIVGDPIYGSKENSLFFGLHAREFCIRNPDSGEDLKITASPPTPWSEVLRLLKSK